MKTFTSGKSSDEIKKQVLSLLRRNGSFVVSWRYRDNPLRNVCNEMIKDGLLKRTENRQGRAIYKPTNNLDI